MLILALPLISIIFKNKLGSFETDCRWAQAKKITLYLYILKLIIILAGIINC